MRKLLFFIVFLSFFIKNCPAEESCSEDFLFSYGLEKYEKEEFSLAIFAFDRFIFLYPNDKKKDEAYIWLALSYKAGGEYEKAFGILKKISRGGNFTREEAIADLLLACFFAEKKDSAQAVLWAEKLLRSTEDKELKKAALLVAAAQYLKNHDMQTASFYLQAMPEEDIPDARALWEAFQREDLAGLKSPFLTGLYSIIPGGGYLYLGRKETAFMAFGLTFAVGAASFEAFDKDMPVLGGILALVSLGFYGGSIKGSIREVEKVNQRLRLSYEEELFKDFGRELSLPLEALSIKIKIPF